MQSLGTFAHLMVNAIGRNVLQPAAAEKKATSGAPRRVAARSELDYAPNRLRHNRSWNHYASIASPKNRIKSCHGSALQDLAPKL